MTNACCLVWFVTALQVSNTLSFTVGVESKLRLDLFDKYNTDVRPDPVTKITLAISITSIDGVDIKNQHFSIAGWWSMRWTDKRLTWNPDNYSSIPVLQVFPDKMWTPTLVVDNSVKYLGAVEADTIPARVTSGGHVVWNPPGILKVSCEMDITYFPFDEQICDLQVTSFGYTIQELDIRVHGDGVVTTYFEPNGEWDLLNNWKDRDTFSEDGYKYSRVYYYFKIKRKPLYYGLNIILPVLINAILTMFVFLLPADSGEKIGYCLTVLLAFMVILTLIATDLPQTAKYISILQIYIALVLIMGGMSVVFSIITLHIFHKTEDNVPKTMQKVTRLVAYVCCKNTCTSNKTKSDRKDSTSSFHGALNDPLGRENYQTLYNPNAHWPRAKPKFMNRRHSGKVLPEHHTNQSKPTTATFVEDKTDKSEDVTWQDVSITLDALLFRVYAVFLFVSTTFIMLRLACH